MEVPGNIFYTKDHEWVSAKTGTVTVGISAHAIEQLGDVVHIELPGVGEKFAQGDSFGTVESTKTVSDLYIPGEAEVIETNEKLASHPETLAEDPYKEGWMIKVKLNQEITSGLMNAKEYETYIKEN